MNDTWKFLISPSFLLELTAALLGVVAVWLTVRQHIACWPVGAVMVALYAYIFFQERLYADAGLQVIYFVLQFYGWYEWLYGSADHKELHVTRASPRLMIPLLIGGAVCTVALGAALRTWTNQDVAYLDSAITAYSLIAQWMMARKLLENWLVWIGVDSLALCVYTYKGLYPTGVLYVIFLIMCVAGYISWRKSMASPPAPKESVAA